MSKIFELYGYRYDNWNGESEENLSRANCPFMVAECDGGGNRQMSAVTLKDHAELAKHFRGQAKVQAGVCSLLVGDDVWIVCPRRLLSLKNAARNNYQEFVRNALFQKAEFPHGEYRVWSEAKFKLSSKNEDEEEKSFDYTFDYVIAGSVRKKLSEVMNIVGLTERECLKIGAENGYTFARRDGVVWVDNFPSDPLLIVEIMTSSTSGGNKDKRTQIAMAFEDAVLRKNHEGPGINYRQVWARMVSQLIVKSQVALAWNGKTVWLIQDVLSKYISDSTALNLKKYISEHPDEVNILSFGYGKTGTEPISPIKEVELFAGKISTAQGKESGFVDIVKIGCAPHKDLLWRSLFKKHHSTTIVV